MKLKELREAKGIKSTTVSKALKVDRNTFRKFEDGKSSLRVEWLKTLSFFYGIPQDTIIEMYLKERGM